MIVADPVPRAPKKRRLSEAVREIWVLKKEKDWTSMDADEMVLLQGWGMKAQLENNCG